MKNFFLSILLTISTFTGLYSQNTLFDESRVSSVYIEIHPDSLAVIMTDVLSEHYFKAKFIYNYGTGSDTLQDVGFRLRGNTSRYSKKKSFKISFNEYATGRKYQGVKKINLNGQHNDPTMVREKLFYDSWKKAGLPERRTSFVCVYINHTYYGLYTNLEEFDKDWLQKVYGENDGNLYKCTFPADLVYKGANQQTYKNIVSNSSTGGRAYDLQTNETADNYADLVDLITILNLPADSVFVARISQKLNVDGFLKVFALDVATGNWDDYMYNKNNFFLYHRADTDKFEFIAYDADNTFGIDWVNLDWTTRNCLAWYNEKESRPLASKILSVPVFKAKYKFYLDSITREIINPDMIFPHIDSMEVLITDAASTDTYRTLDYGYTMIHFHNGFIQKIDNHSPYGIKPFISKRITTIKQQLSPAAITEQVKDTYTLEVYPNPADRIVKLKVSASPDNTSGYIVDASGKQQKAFILPKNQAYMEIPVSDLAPGIYTLVLMNRGQLLQRRFVKQ